MNNNICTKLELISKAKTYGKDEFIFHQGDQSDTFYYLKSGLIQGIVTSSDGQEYRTITNWPGSIFGATTFLIKEPRQLSAITCRKSEIITIDEASYKIFQHTIPNFNDIVLRSLVSDVKILFERLYTDNLLDRRINVARFISRRIEDGIYSNKQGHMELLFTQDFIANTLGLSRWSVNKALCEFKDYGWLKTSYGKIIVIDYESIRKFAYESTVI